MKYVEARRTDEPHSECILFLYLQDAEGVPVPDTRIKIWAGPPPEGEPPYFVDDDPENPSRLTDSSGKFQFIVSNVAPTDPLDFYVQVMGVGGIPQSERVHFSFPQNETRCATVTLVEELPAAVEERASAVIAEMPSRQPSTGTVHGRVTIAPTRLSSNQKLFDHYLLFGPGSQPSTMTNLIIALDYIVRYAPLVGFSSEEAKNAQHVTVVGDADSVSIEVEQSLRQTGCVVSRLAAPDSYALESVFKHLIDSGSPYPTR